MSKREIKGFQHLHLHSSYGSLLDAVSKPIAYCEKAANIGQLELQNMDRALVILHLIKRVRKLILI